MSFFSAASPATSWLPKAGPRWYYKRETPLLTNEGDEVVLSIMVLNPNVGSCIAPWMTGGKSLAAGGNWERSWHDVFTEVCAANGCTYRRLSTTTTPRSPGGTIAGLITVGEGYQGQTMYFRNRSRRNRRNDATNPDGTPGYREMQILMQAQGASGTPERAFNGSVGKFIGGNKVQVQDTSRRPTGTPTIRAQLLDEDGNPSPLNLYAGDRVRVRFPTENMTVLSQLKVMTADEGQKDTIPQIQTGLERAAAASNCAIYIPTFNRDGAAGYYRGGAITFSDAVNGKPGYVDSQPIDMLFELKGSPDETETRHLLFIASIVQEGDLVEFDTTAAKGDFVAGGIYRRGDWVTWLQDGGTYVYYDETASNTSTPADTDKWRPFRKIQTGTMAIDITVRPFPPRYWELRSTVAGSTIVYAIQLPLVTYDAAGLPIANSVTLASVGAPPGFNEALADAAAAHPGVEYAGGVLTSTVTARADSELSFFVPLAGAGKHTMRFVDPSGPAPIVIGDACVFLTPPVLPAPAGFRIGVNLSGGEFASDNAPGTYSQDYAYPNDTELDYWKRQGAGIIRLPVRWERIADGLFGPLSGADRTGPISGRDDARRLDAFIASATGKGFIVLFDIHNYMAFKPIGRVGPDREVPVGALVDVCVKVAERYANVPNLWLDPMNEPSGTGMSATRTSDIMQWIINGVRGRTGFLGKILVEGSKFSSSMNWIANGQAAAFDRLYDPAGNVAFQPHCYLDFDASGTDATGACVSGADGRLDPPLTWAAATGREIFIGEIAGSGLDPTCQVVLPAAYQKLRAHPNCIGWTTWGGGRRWYSTYAFRLDPQDYANGADTPQLAMLKPFLGT